MSATVSTNLIFFENPNAWVDIFRPLGTAVSKEAGSAHYNRNHVAHHIEHSESLYGEKSSALSALRALAIECNAHDWDGEGALPVSMAAFQIAEHFIRALPDGLPMPEFASEPDGAISLDWIKSRHKMFSISVGARPRLAYAWLDGSNRGNAVEHFDGERIPYRLLNEIQRTMQPA